MQFVTWGALARARQASSTAKGALAQTREIREDTVDLHAQVDRLQMICEGMWRIMKTRLGATEEDLMRLIEEIDLRDGKLDGRVAPTPATCSACGRVVSIRTFVCLFCGTKNARPTVF